MEKYIKFKPVEYKGKTERFEVRAISDDSILGIVQWYSPWRQYVFIPGFPAMWSFDCLQDIQNLLTYLNDEHTNPPTKG